MMFLNGITSPSLLSLILLISPSLAIERDQCATAIHHLLSNGTFSPYDRSKFWEVPTSNSTLSITQNFCTSQCGSGSWYSSSEITARLVVWLLPVLVLMGNLYMPPLSLKYKIFSLIHMLGDPVDALLSLQHTLAVRRAAYRWAEEAIMSQQHLHFLKVEDLATVTWAIDTLDAGSVAEAKKALISFSELPNITSAVQEAAADVRAATVKEPTRTYLAIAIYLSTLTSAFIKASSAKETSTSRPGNRIAFAMLFSWLLPVILLSTFAYRFTTADACAQAIRHLCQHLKVDQAELMSREVSRRTLYDGTLSEEKADEAAAWSGAIYVFRPRKPIFWTDDQHYMSPSYMLLLALAPVCIALTIAIGISYNTPTSGFGCRSITHLSIATLWMLSFFMTITLQKLRFLKGKYLLWIVAMKDLVIGGGALLTVILVFAGAFNSCWCWSNGLNGILGNSLHVLLGISKVLQENAESIYPGLVGGGIGAQVVSFLLMWAGGWEKTR